MIRNCDGTDPNLRDADGLPCQCGATFDDVNQRVIYPHEMITHLSDAEREALIRKYTRNLNTPEPNEPV